MENNNILLEEVNEVMEDGMDIIDTTIIDTNMKSDLTKNLLIFGAGIAIATATPVVYRKILKPGFKKLFGKKEEVIFDETEAIDVDSEEVSVDSEE